MAEATIDELQIQIESDSTDASQSIDKLRQSLEKLLAPVQALTAGNGLNRLTKQLEKLAEAARAASSLSGFDKISQAATALRSLDTLTGNPKVGSYVTAINRLSQAAPAVQSIAAMPDISSQLTALTNALNTLRNVQDIRLTSLTNSLQQLPAAVQAINGMPAVDMSRIEALNTALSAFRTGSAQGIRSLVNALNRLPQVAQQINRIDFRQFENNIRQLTNSLEPLLQRAQAATQGLNSLATILRLVRNQSGNGNSMGSLSNTLGGLSTKSLLSWGSLMKLRRALTECFQVSSQYVENLNLFNVTMGASAKTAMEFAEKVNDALGIDTSDWLRYQGFFQSVGKGFGVASEKADLMSQNLTQLAYDISSFYNISTDEAYNKVQSGFAGELEPLRRLGFALDEATLKQLAYSKGITQTYESMTQAQKSQLRYVAMIEQARNIGVTGDMSRTIDTAANGVRVLEARLQQFARAIGNMLMPMLSAILPYLTAFIQVVTEGANALANMLGFELPKINLDSVTNGYDDITAATEEATAATEKFKGSLAGVDQLNIIGSKSDETGSGAGYSTDLDIELPTYDFLNGVESKTKEIAENMKRFFQEALPWIEAVAAAVGAIFLTTKVMNFVSALGKVFGQIRQFNSVLGDKSKGFWGIAGGLAAGASSGILLYNSIKNLIKGTGNLAGNWVKLVSGIGIASGAIAAFIALGNPIGAVVTGVLALSGAVLGAVSAIDEVNSEIANAIFYADTGGISVEDFAQCYSNFFDSISDKYQKVNEVSEAIRQNRDDAEKAADQIYNLTDKYKALGGAMTSEDAQTLKDNIETIGKAIKENLGLYTQTLVDNLKTSFHDLAKQMGIDVDGMIGKWRLLENMGNSALAEMKKEADELSIKIINGEATEAEYQQFEDTVSKMSTVNTYTPEQEGLNRALSEVMSGNIDFKSEDQVKSAIETITSSAQSARDVVNTAWNNQKADINNYKATLINWGVDETYDEKFGKGEFEKLFNDQIALINEGYSQELNKIDVTEKTGIGAIWAQADQKVIDAFDEQKPGFWDYFVANITALPWEYFTGDHWTGKNGSEKAYAMKESDRDDRIEGLKSGEYKGTYDALKATGLSDSDVSYYGEIGSYIVQGFKNGVLSSADDFNTAMDILAEEGVEAFKKHLKIASPSKVFEELGGYVTQGLALGITEGADDVDTSIDDIALGMTSRMPANNSKIGFAWEGAKEMYSSNAPVDNSVSVGDTNVTVEIDGEELANYVVKAQNRQVIMANGR